MKTGADERARVPAWLVLGGAALVGVLTAVQARINGQLGLRLDDGLVAAAISFASGLVILIVLSAALPGGRRGFAALAGGLRAREIPWWMLAGGAAGALTVATQGLAVGVIGVSLFTVGVVAGQAMNGLILDRVGYGPAGVVAVTVPRVVGALLALIAVGLGLLGGGVSGIPLWMLALPFVAGVGIAWQQATNGRLRQRVGTPLTATLVNFIGGTMLLVLAAIVHVVWAGAPADLPSEPWLYVGRGDRRGVHHPVGGAGRLHRRAAARARRCRRPAAGRRADRRAVADDRQPRVHPGVRDGVRRAALRGGRCGALAQARPALSRVALARGCAPYDRRFGGFSAGIRETWWRASTPLRRPRRERGGFPPT